VTFNEIKSLLVLFPDLISKEQYDVLFAEYTDYQTADDLPFHDESERIDTYWFSLYCLKNSSDNQPRFGTLCVLAMYILLIPHSNSFCESLFSIVKKNVSDVHVVRWVKAKRDMRVRVSIPTLLG